VETLKRGIGMTGAVVFGHLFFGERATLQKALAVAILTAGVALTLMRS
jgi:multidrug transporter EmrE-like cation transporter